MILVDPPREYPTKLRYKVWSHMVSDSSEEELHEFAARLGLRREWFQDGSYAHYDLTAAKQRQALRLGAVEVPSRELLVRNYDYRRKRGLP